MSTTFCVAGISVLRPRPCHTAVNMSWSNRMSYPNKKCVPETLHLERLVVTCNKIKLCSTKSGTFFPGPPVRYQRPTNSQGQLETVGTSLDSGLDLKVLPATESTVAVRVSVAILSQRAKALNTRSSHTVQMQPSRQRYRAPALVDSY